MPPESTTPTGLCEGQGEQLIRWCREQLAGADLEGLATCASRVHDRALPYTLTISGGPERDIRVVWLGVTLARPELITTHQPASPVIFEPVVFETRLVPIDDETEPGRA